MVDVTTQFAAATALSNSHIRSAVNEVLANRAKAAAANYQQGETYGDASVGGGNDVVQNKDESIDIYNFSTITFILHIYVQFNIL